MAIWRRVIDSRVLAMALRCGLLSLALASTPWAAATQADGDSQQGQPEEPSAQKRVIRAREAGPLPDSASSLRLREEQQWGRKRSARPDPASSTPVSVGEPTPRLRFGAGLVLGVNEILESGSSSAGPDGTHGTPGIGFSLRLGSQWTELLGTEIEVTGLFGPLLVEGRVALLVGFTPPDSVISLGIGPATGYEAATTAGFNIFGPVSPGYAGNYVGGEARIDFLPGVGPVTSFPRAQRSLDIGIVAVIWAPTGGAQQGHTLFGGGMIVGWGVYLELGFLQF